MGWAAQWNKAAAKCLDSFLCFPLYIFSRCIFPVLAVCLQVESSMQELSAFMSNANSTLDESLEEDEGLLGATLSSLSSLPSSVKATPRGPPSAEASSQEP